MKNIGVGLHNHTEYSFLDGLQSTDAAAKKAQEIGMRSLAITDHGEVGGHYAFQRSCDKYEIKPILGIEGYLVDSVSRVREEKDRKNSHMCLFAENNEGLRNLWALSSRAYIDGLYYKPLSDWSMLDGKVNGVIATDGCLLTYMARAIEADDSDAATNLIGQYCDIFGRDNFYMELHTFSIIDPKSDADFELNARMAKMNQGKVALATKYKIPMIVVNDSHFANECDWQNHSLVWSMSTFDKNGDQAAKGKSSAWIMDDSEMYYWMERHGIGKSVVEKALHNTAEIADRCTARIEPGFHIPSLTGSPEGDKKLFRDQIEIGFQAKVVDKGLDVEKYRARVEEETGLILRKNFEGYFNIVSDYVKHAKEERQMLVGSGRGSGGGSIVNYLMGITSVDAIKYDLLFSRFLNEARVDMPDIDVDFPQSRRQEMTKEYLPARYGADKICVIGTLSRSQPAGIAKDLSRAMGISYDESNALSKIFQKASLPQGITAHQAWELTRDQLEDELAPYKARNPLLFEKINEMVGLIRQSSTHAAGVIISDVPLLGQIPLRIKGKETMPVTQFENSEGAGNDDVTKMGFLKYDFLGLRTLDTLEVAFELVKERHGLTAKNSTEFYESFGDKEYTDKATWEMIAAGDTLGCFQIETSFATHAAKRMKPLNEVDMADLISVNRPGVIKAGLLEEYFDRKDGIKEYKISHPLLEPILDRTYGIVVYQEQALKIFLNIANYAPAEAEKMRKMIGKKLVDKMEAEKPRFAQRCLDNPEFMSQIPAGSSADSIVAEMWNSIEATASYAFNEAHAIGYSLTACQCAYMKSTYPEEFLTALLRTDPDKTALYVREIRRRGYKILPPSINDSGDKFTLTDDGIRYGITAVMGVANVAYKEIAAHRPYSNFEDFLGKVSKRACNSKVVENLISIGAFDALGDRMCLMDDFYTARKIKDKTIPNFNLEEVVQEIEMRLVGSYISVDPMEKFHDIIDGECMSDPAQIDELETGKFGYIGGQIEAIKHHNTKAKNDPMCFMSVAWNDHLFEVVVFPRAFAGYHYFLETTKPVIMRVEKLDSGSVHAVEILRLDRL